MRKNKWKVGAYPFHPFFEYSSLHAVTFLAKIAGNVVQSSASEKRINFTVSHHIQSIVHLITRENVYTYFFIFYYIFLLIYLTYHSEEWLKLIESLSYFIHVYSYLWICLSDFAIVEFFKIFVFLIHFFAVRFCLFRI